MEKLNYNDQSSDIILLPKDVELAVIDYIKKTYPEMNEDWILGVKYNVGSVVIAATKK